MRASLSFLTTTSITGDDRAEAPAAQTLELLGYDRVEIGRASCRERV